MYSIHVQRWSIVLCVVLAALVMSFDAGETEVSRAAAQEQLSCTWQSIGNARQPHYYVASAFDTDNNALYLYGGLDERQEAQDDFEVLDLSDPSLGNAAHRSINVSALQRYGAAGAYRPAGDDSAVYFFGGADDADQGVGESDIQAYDIADDKWSKLSAGQFEDRVFAAAAYDPGHDAIWVVGGIRECGLADLPCTSSNVPTKYLKFDPVTGPALVTGPAGGPSSVFGHSMVYDAAGNRMLVYGGMKSTSKAENKVWLLDLSDPNPDNATWSSITPAGGPQGLALHGAALDTARNWMIVYGGATSDVFEDGESALNETYALDLGATPPAWADLDANFGERVGGAMAYDPVHQVPVFHGGRGRVRSGSTPTAYRESRALMCEVVIVPTPTPTPDRTSSSGLACNFIQPRVPGQVIAWALSNQHRVRGWGELCYPSQPRSPYNVERTMLSIQNTGQPFHPLYNSVVWKCGCP